MNKARKIMVLILSVMMMIASVSSVMAMTAKDEIINNSDNTRMYSSSIAMSMDFIDEEVVMYCSVTGPLDTESISILFILREENSVGNLVIADTWNDSGTGAHFSNEYSYSPAIEGKEYELSVRVGIYDANGLVGYDYKTISAVN